MSDLNFSLDISMFIWRIGHILQTMINIHDEQDKAIPAGIFKTGMELFDSLGRFNFGFYKKSELKNRITDFLNEHEYKCYFMAFYSIIDYAKDTILHLVSFIEANIIKI